ncbi:MAG TPA: hypothetical protein ENN21_04870 [Spirochaetes bacterium]|nr:hypothetical protein [Spirochaetota bacterium]
MVDKKDNGVITSNIYDGRIYERLNPLVERLTGFLFRRVDFDAESLAALEECVAGNRRIVYASFHSSNISLLIFYNLLRRKGYETPVFALEYNPFLLQKAGFVWKRLVKLFNRVVLRKKYRYVFDTNYVRDLVERKESIILSLMSRWFFLKRYTEIKYDSLVHLVEVQKTLEEPIFLVPQMIFWNRNPERSGSGGAVWTSPRDFFIPRATGDKGLLSGWIASLRSMAPAFVRLSPPLNLKEEIANSRSTDSRQIAIELRNKLLGIYHHEKRTILGPVVKSRQEMMEKVLYHRNVLEVIDEIAGAEKKPLTQLRKKAFKYYREIAANYRTPVIITFKNFMDWVFRRIYDGISYDPEAIKEIREAAQKGPIILTPCHKSHMDYLIISYLLFENKMYPPHIAAGINLSFFPLGFIFRSSGAFFLRRSFKGKKLYAAVFKQYVKTLVSEGYSIEFFIEGGRTRTGRLVFPKLGFLSYLIEALEEGYNKDLIVVPVSISYDRILEEQTYQQELRGKKKKNESMSSVLQSGRYLRRKYGKVYVSFNKPFSVKEIVANPTGGLSTAEETAHTIIRKINEVTMVTPFALVTTAILLSSVKGFSRAALEERIAGLLRYLRHCGVGLSESLSGGDDFAEIIDYVFASYHEDKIIEELQVQGAAGREVVKDYYVLREDNRARIVFYKNNIIHYFISLSLGCAALARFVKEGPDVDGAALREAYNELKDLFARDFIFSENDDCGAGPLPEKVMTFLVADGLVSMDGDRVRVSADRAEDLGYFAKLCRDHLESYLVVLHTLMARRAGKMSRKDLMIDIRREGVTLYHGGHIHLSESLSIPNYGSALEKLVDAKVLEERPAGGRNTEIILSDRDAAARVHGMLKHYLDLMP